MPLAPFNAYTNRFAPLQDALQSLISSNDQSDAQDKQNARQLLAMYAQNPALAIAFKQANPDYANVQLPAPQMTDQDRQNAAVAAAITAKKLRDLDGSAVPSTIPGNDAGQPSFSTMFTQSGAGMPVGQPNAYDRLNVDNRVNNYLTGKEMPSDLLRFGETAYTQGQPGLVAANRIANKQDLNADEQRLGSQFQQEYTGIKQPESVAKISTEKSTQAKNYADVNKLGAETTKVGAETAGINATNSMFGGATTAAPGQSATVAGPPDPNAPAGGGASPLVRAMVARKADPAVLTAIARRNPATAQALEAQAQALDPQFSWAEYPKQVANLKEYSQAGQTGKNVTSINTAVKHLNAYLDDLGQMNNMNFGGQYGNAVINGVGSFLGNEGIQQHGQTVEKEAEAVATELNKSFRGSSQLSEKDTAQWRQGLSQNTTPAQGLGAASAAVRLLASRIQEIANSYKRDTGLNPPDFLASVRPILQKFKKLGVEGVDDLMGNAGAASTTPAAGGSGGKQLDSATAGAFLAMAGGDKDKARQLATAAGYSF